MWLRTRVVGGPTRRSPSDRLDPGRAGPRAGELSAILRAKPNYAALGAIGPDLSFFLPDFHD